MLFKVKVYLFKLIWIKLFVKTWFLFKSSSLRISLLTNQYEFRLLKSNPLLGLNIVKEFVYDGVKWTDGKIYDSRTGKTYSGNMSMTGLNQLNMRGYIGISLIGITENWKRVK